MPDRATLTVLVDDRAGEGLDAEHGWALWIEAADECILFDTGQGGVPVGNARRLGADLGGTTRLVLSHGHYDHTGGVHLVLDQALRTQVYAHRAAIQPRYGLQNGWARPIHMPHAARTALQGLFPPRLHWISVAGYVAPGVGVTGPIPRETDYEDTGGPFFLDSEGQRPDPLEDDLALWLVTPRGLVVCLGCAHAGVINTLNHVRRLNGSARLHAVIGGFHLLQATDERMTRTAAALRALAPDLVIPCHCTGEEAVHALEAELGDRVMAGHAGFRYRTDDT